MMLWWWVIVLNIHSISLDSALVTETVTPPIPHSTVTVCTDRNITVYTDTNTETARVELAEGLTYIDLSEGTHVYETRTEHNTSCITTFHVINNRTGIKLFNCFMISSSLFGQKILLYSYSTDANHHHISLDIHVLESKRSVNPRLRLEFSYSSFQSSFRQSSIIVQEPNQVLWTLLS